MTPCMTKANTTLLSVSLFTVAVEIKDTTVSCVSGARTRRAEGFSVKPEEIGAFVNARKENLADIKMPCCSCC